MQNIFLCKRYFIYLSIFYLFVFSTDFLAINSENSKLRILYILSSYPVLSETYMHEEIKSIRKYYNIKIVVLKSDECINRKNYFSHEFVELKNIGKVIEEFNPDIIHTHWFTNSPRLKKLADAYHIPFTIRTHSFDILTHLGSKLQSFCEIANSNLCLKVLCFPPFKKILIEHGLPENKITCCWPVVRFSRFYNPDSKNSTKRICNISAGLIKNGIKKFIDLAVIMQHSGFEFNLYAVDHFIKGVNLADNFKLYNKEKGNPVTNITYVEPEDMPYIYRQHDWVVLTSNPKINAVGFPVVIAEAQASGIGVCWQELPGRREDQLEYLGGAGFLFKSIDELPAILEQPYPESMRLAGLKNAKKCDIEDHKVLLTQVWDNL